MSLYCAMIFAVVSQSGMSTEPASNGCWRVYSYFQEIDGVKSSEKCLNQYVVLTDNLLIDCNLERGKRQIRCYELSHRRDDDSSMRTLLSQPFEYGQPIGKHVTAHFDMKNPRVCRFRFDGHGADGHPLVLVYFAERLSHTNDAMTSLHRELQSVFENPHDLKRLEEFSPTNSDAPSNGYWNVEAIRIWNGAKVSERTGFNLEKRLVMLSDGYFSCPVLQNHRWVGGYEYRILAQDSTDEVRRCILNTPFSWGASLQRKMTVRYEPRSDQAEIEFSNIDRSFKVVLSLKRLTDDQRAAALGEMRWPQDLFVAANRPRQ